MTEKIALADGRVDAAALLEACREAARQLVAFDMAALADATGSVVSAVLFGALAGSGALPFPRTAFEAAIRRGQVGVEKSLAAFGAGFEAARAGEATVPSSASAGDDARRVAPTLRALSEQAGARFLGRRARGRHGGARTARRLSGRRLRPRLPGAARAVCKKSSGSTATAPAGCSRKPRGSSRSPWPTRTRSGWPTSKSDRAASRGCAKKCRSRTARILEIAEFFHPRTQEIADTLPAALGRWLLRSGWARAVVDRATRKGRIVKTTSIGGFLLLYALSRLKPLRRRSLRFATEQAALAVWLDLVAESARSDYALALQVARMRGLVKGYGETHERGRMKFEKLVELVPRLRGRRDAERAARRADQGRARRRRRASLGQGHRRSGADPERGRGRRRGFARPGAARPSLASRPVALALAGAMGEARAWDVRPARRQPTMSYDLDQFVSDCRAILKRDGGPKGREEVRVRLERLLSNPDFVEHYCGEHVPRGLKVLYEDPELGFQVLAHINDKARVSPPHDHGESWAIYGQATHYTEMTEWEREDDGDQVRTRPS